MRTILVQHSIFNEKTIVPSLLNIKNIIIVATLSLITNMSIGAGVQLDKEMPTDQALKQAFDIKDQLLEGLQKGDDGQAKVICPFSNDFNPSLKTEVESEAQATFETTNTGRVLTAMMLSTMYTFLRQTELPEEPAVAQSDYPFASWDSIIHQFENTAFIKNALLFTLELTQNPESNPQKKSELTTSTFDIMTLIKEFIQLEKEALTLPLPKTDEVGALATSEDHLTDFTKATKSKIKEQLPSFSEKKMVVIKIEERVIGIIAIVTETPENKLYLAALRTGTAILAKTEDAFLETFAINHLYWCGQMLGLDTSLSEET